MDGAELYCFEDFESQLSTADEPDGAAGKHQYTGTLANGIIRDVRTDGYQAGSDDPAGNQLKPGDVNGQGETSNQQLAVKLGHGNQQQDGRLDHPAFLGKSQGGAKGRSTAAAAGGTSSTQRFLHRGRTVDIPDSAGSESTASRFRQGLLVRSQSTDEGKDVQRGPRELMSYSERRKLQLNQRTRGIKPGSATDMDRDDIGSVQTNGMEPTENTAVLDHVDKLSVRARPDVNLHNKKNAKIRDGPPVTGLRAGRSGSPRSWNFATQSIVPRFTNRDDSEILSAIRRSPTFKSSGDERRKPLVTNCSVDSALDQQIMESSSIDPNNRGFSMECLLTDAPETISIFGPGDLIKDVIFKTGSNNAELPAGLFVSTGGTDEKDGRLRYLSSRDVAPGLPPSGRGRKLVSNKLVRGRNIPATTEDLCDCREGSDKSPGRVQEFVFTIAESGLLIINSSADFRCPHK